MRINSSPDKSKADSLRKMAETTLKRLKETVMEKYPSNTLVDYYDIIHKLMEAITSEEGIKFSGEGAHHELITFICNKLRLNEEFLQQLREYRNRISYEGFFIQPAYIRKNKDRIEKVI